MATPAPGPRPVLVLSLLLCLAAACGPARAPAGGGALGQADLRYRLIDTLGPPAYCDPYDYPVAHREDDATAAAEVAALRARAPDELDAIVRHERLDAAHLSPDDDRRIARQSRLLAALAL